MNNERHTTEGSPDHNKMELELVDYIGESRLSAEDVQRAYYNLFSSGTDEVATNIEELTKKMAMLIKQGYPFQRIHTLIEAMHLVIQEKVQVTVDFINSLPISKKESQMLISIIESKREGTLSTHLQGGNIFVSNLVIKK